MNNDVSLPGYLVSRGISIILFVLKCMVIVLTVGSVAV